VLQDAGPAVVDEQRFLLLVERQVPAVNKARPQAPPPTLHR
jgi:hypothetical protein